MVRRAILGGISEAAKNYVIRVKDRVMSWSNGVAPRLERDQFAPPSRGKQSAMVSNAAAARAAAVRTWFQAVQLTT